MISLVLMTLAALAVSAAAGFVFFTLTLALPNSRLSFSTLFKLKLGQASLPRRTLLVFLKELKFKIGTQRKIEKIKDLFPSTLGMALQALKAGQTIPQVLEYLSTESAPPLREEWAKVCAEMNLGASAEQALSQMGERYPSFTDYHQFLQSYKIARQTGANLSTLLEVLLEGIDTRDRLSRKMDSMTAQARLSGLLMGLLPFFLILVFFFMDPSLLRPLVTQKLGWGILALSAAMECVGFLWIRQLLRIEF
jgi:tight adherence protein B